jgi:hypothetical protein
MSAFARGRGADARRAAGGATAAATAPRWHARAPSLAALLALLALVLGLPGTALRAQDKPPPSKEKDDEDAAKLALKDPYTGADPQLMAAVGIVSYGPFPWADNFRTEDIDRVLGENRVAWVETAHFRIGFNMKSAPLPEGAAPRKALLDEVKALKKKLPKVAEKPKRLDPWLRLHLAVQRCEKAYSEFLQLIGATDADFPAKGKLPGEGAYLGQPDKFLVLLFQKRSDMARYMERFCNRKENVSMRFYHDKTFQMLLAIAAEGLEDFDEAGLHGHMVYALWHNLMNAYRGYGFPLPHWFGEGIAHWYGRKVESDFLNIQIRDDEAVAGENQANWPVKVRRRAQHDGAWFPFETMAAWAKWEDLGYHAHSQSWSRLDYLMSVDKAKVGEMLRKLKSVPPDGTFEGQAGKLRVMAQQLLFELFELDAAEFDRRWREWVLKTYPKK